MSNKRTQKLITPEILRDAIVGSFKKLNPRYMMKNPVMFVVEVGCAISLIFLSSPGCSAMRSQKARTCVCTILSSAWCCL